MYQLLANKVAHCCILAIESYRRWLSPLWGPRCRFYPSCSEYALLCLEKHPLLVACFKILKRLLCCNPFHSGGVDLP